MSSGDTDAVMYSLTKEQFLLRWFLLTELLGSAFAHMSTFFRFAFKYIFNKEGSDEELQHFALESDNILFQIGDTRPTFEGCTDAYMEKVLPVGAVLVSQQENCRECGRKLILDMSWKTVVIYHIT
jgi:hypothetical protein